MTMYIEFILYLNQLLHNTYKKKKKDSLIIISIKNKKCIILIELGKICVNQFGIEEPIKILFKGGGERKTQL